MRIPEVRAELLDIANHEAMPEMLSQRLLALREELHRRPVQRKGRAVSKTMTDRLRRQITEFAEDNPEMTQVEIGRQFNVNQGRVSEALFGFRQ